MENDSEKFEYESRHCPICGKFVKIEPPMHRCLKKDLNNIYKKYENELEEELKDEIDRTYDDKLNEFDELYNSDNYYDKDIEDE